MFAGRKAIVPLLLARAGMMASRAKGLKSAVNKSKVGSATKGAARGLASGAGWSAGAAKGAAIGAGVGWSVRSGLSGHLTAGLPTILFNFFIDAISVVSILIGNPALPIHIAWAAVMFLFVIKDESGKRDPLLVAILMLNLLPALVSLPEFINLFGSQATNLLANTIANPFIPWWSIYAGFFRNPRQGKLSSLIFWMWVILFLSVGYTLGADEISKIPGLDQRISQGQQEYALKGVDTARTSVGTLVGDAVQGVLNFPNQMVNFFTGQTKKLYPDLNGGKKADQPKRGILIKNHPISGYSETDHSKKFKATIAVENLPPEKNFFEISNAECQYEGNKSFDADEFKGENEKIRIFQNYDQTVTCTFDAKDHNNLKDIDEVKLTVDYDFETHAKLETYVMKNSLLQDLQEQNVNPFDHMNVLDSPRKPITLYDNTPATFFIGPIELEHPPLGIKDGKTYPDFELIIGNRADFRGKIKSIKDLSIVLPRGFSLSGSSCQFEHSNSCIGKGPDCRMVYKIKDNKNPVNIKNKKLYTCEMNIDASGALGPRPFSQIEFDVFANFTYQTGKTLRGN